MNGMTSIGICLAVCAVASLTDWRSYRIPNWLTIPAVFLGLGMGAIDGVQGVLAALVGASVCALTPLILCALGAMGGGDLKLLMAMGALLGAKLGLTAQLYAFAAASLWGIGTWRGSKTQLRFAPSVLVGVLGALVSLVGFP
jgi:prepilin peptidase CpaA